MERPAQLNLMKDIDASYQNAFRKIGGEIDGGLLMAEIPGKLFAVLLSENGTALITKATDGPAFVERLTMNAESMLRQLDWNKSLSGGDILSACGVDRFEPIDLTDTFDKKVDIAWSVILSSEEYQNNNNY